MKRCNAVRSFTLTVAVRFLAVMFGTVPVFHPVVLAGTGILSVYSTVCGTMYGTMVGVQVDFPGGGSPTVQGTVDLGRTAAMHGSVGRSTVDSRCV